MRRDQLTDHLRLASAIRRIAQCLDVQSRRLASKYGITLSQLLCLIAVVAREGLTSRQIADEIFIGPSTLVGVLDRLENKGLIRRRRNPSDRREIHILPTTEGRRLVSRVPSPLGQRFHATASGLGDARQQTLLRALHQTTDMMLGDP